MKYRSLLCSLFLFTSALYAEEDYFDEYNEYEDSFELANQAKPAQPYKPPAPTQQYPTPSSMGMTSSTPANMPCFTGPLIAPIGMVIPWGHFEFQNYIFCTTNTGTYNAHWDSVSAPHNFFSFNPQIFAFFGLTSWMDINVIPSFMWNTTDGQSSWEFADLPVGLDFQLLDPSYTPYFPGIKFTVQEIFPTGNYQTLNPHKKFTDQSGLGSYGTNFQLVLYKVYHLAGKHYLSTTVTGSCILHTPVHVRGFNTYGGGDGCNGKVLPGNQFEGIVSFEFSFNKYWVFSVDNVYIHVNKTQFYGNPGTVDGDTSSVGGPSTEQVSFAPALEYNFNCNFGIIAGCWFTAWGRNSTQFRSGVVNFCYMY